MQPINEAIWSNRILQKLIFRISDMRKAGRFPIIILIGLLAERTRVKAWYFTAFYGLCFQPKYYEILYV